MIPVTVLSEPIPNGVRMRGRNPYAAELQEPSNHRCVVIPSLSEFEALKQVAYRKGWKLRRQKQVTGGFKVWRVA
jgi:hypothetical protein